MSQAQQIRNRSKHVLTPFFLYVCNHPVFANLLLVAIILIGAVTARQIPVQAMPNFPWPVISVRIVWPGADIDTIADRVTVALTNELMSVGQLSYLESYSRHGEGLVVLTYQAQADMRRALDEVQNRVASVDLPRGCDQPVILEETLQDPLLQVVLYGDTLDQLRFWANDARQQLLSTYQIDQVHLQGLTNQVLSVGMSQMDLYRAQTSISNIADALKDTSVQQPIGTYEDEQINITVRGQNPPKTGWQLEQKTITTSTGTYTVNDIANVDYLADTQEPTIYFKHKPAVTMAISRNTSGASDSQTLVQQFFRWYQDMQQRWPDGIQSHIFLPEYQLIQERLEMLIVNGSWGLVGIIVLLVFFVQWRIAFWITAGVPIAIMGALILMWYGQMSFNFLSSFGLLIALGLIVDDTIVVAERAYTNFQKGMQAKVATEHAVNRMITPILASSITTIGAFMPILLMQSRYAVFLQDVPKVVIAVILASLVECFLILPFHIRRSLQLIDRTSLNQTATWLGYMQGIGRWVQFSALKKALTCCAQYAWLSMGAAVVCVSLPIMLLLTARIPYNFLPYIAKDHIALDVSFHPGTSTIAMQAYMQQAQQALWRVNQQLSPAVGTVIEAPIVQYLLPAFPKDSAPIFAFKKPHHASMLVPLSKERPRQLSNHQLKSAWEAVLPISPAVSSVAIKESQSESTWHDVNILLHGERWDDIAPAAQALKQALMQVQGISQVMDNSAMGRIEYILTPKPQARHLGVTPQVIAEQVGTALNGQEVVINPLVGNTQTTIKLQLDPQEVLDESILQTIPINVNGQQLTLGDCAQWHKQQQPEIYYDFNGRLTIKVSADVDETRTTASHIRQQIQETILPQIKTRYPVEIDQPLTSPDEDASIAEIQYGIIVGLMMIYFVLAWVSRSYGWPFILMSIIPIAFSGALFGHYISGQDFSLLSIIAIFGLSGVVVNLSIILFHQVAIIRAENTKLTLCEQVIAAICARFRAMLLTIATTAIGLAPIVFETSQQAKWVQPFAISFVVGLVFTVLIVCLVVPASASLCSAHRTLKSPER